MPFNLSNQIFSLYSRLIRAVSAGKPQIKRYTNVIAIDPLALALALALALDLALDLALNLALSPASQSDWDLSSVRCGELVA